MFWNRMKAALPTFSKSIPSLVWHLEPDRDEHKAAALAEPLARTIAANLCRDECVSIPSNEPAEALAVGVWNCLPLKHRLKRSLATWVFANSNDYSFSATPPCRVPPTFGTVSQSSRAQTASLANPLGAFPS
jgi:hypothetical protein